MTDIFKTLAGRQLHLMIQKGKFQQECRAEWHKRYGMEYPFHRTANGIKQID